MPPYKRFLKKGQRVPKPKGKKAMVSKKSSSVTYSGIRKLINKQINKKKEFKSRDTNGGKVELYHNVYSMLANLTATNSTYWPDQGDTDYSRDGNEIETTSISIRWMAGLKADRLNTQLRILVISLPKDVNPATYATVFDSVSGNTHLDPVDYDKVRVHYQKFVKPKWFAPVNGTTDELTLFGKIKIPFKHRVKFYENAYQTNNMTRNYHLIVLAYDTYGSLLTDNLCWFQYWSRLYFRDV